MKAATKRLLAGFSAAVMSVSAIGTANAAEFRDDYSLAEDYEVSEVDAQSDITWEITNDGVLKVEGTGVIPTRFMKLTPSESRKIKKVEIGSGITGIAEQAFVSCRITANGVSLYIPSSVKYIGHHAFNGCYFSEVTLSEGLEYIGNMAFNSPRLQTLTIPASVEDIDINPFPCSGLKEVKVAAGNENFVSKDGVLYDVAMTTMFTYPQRKKDTICTLPSTVKNVDVVGLNRNSNLTAVNAGSSYFTSVDGVLFNKGKTELVCCPIGKGITSYTVPYGVKTIGVYALSGNGLETVSIPSSVTTIEEEALSANEFVSVTIPDSVTEIGAYALSNNYKLANVKLPKNLKKISDGMFFDCQAMKSISLPRSVTYMGIDAFANCMALESIDIPDTVTYIGGYAFMSCSSLANIKLPSSLEEIGSGAFAECYALTEITIPGKVTEMGSDIFWGCESLSKVTVSEGVTTIGMYAFNESTALNTVVLPKSLKSIDDGAFSNCTALTSIELPEGLEFIGEYAFGDCGLTSVKIPSKVGYICRYAFDGCENMTEVQIPDFYKNNLDKYVGEGAFPEDAEIKYYSTGSTTVDPTKPVVTAEPTYGGAEVTWEPVDGAVNYRVFTYIPGQKIRQFGSDTKSTSMTVKGLKGGEKTGIIVLAQFANKKWSTYTEDDIAYVIPWDAVKPYLCVNPKGNGNYYLIWSSVPTSVRYKVMAREKGTNNWELIGATRQRCRITVELDPNKQYEFLVRGLNARNKYTPMDADDIVTG